MWTRRELKEKGKVTFKKTYWKHVLVSIVLALALGAAGGASSGVSSSLSSLGNATGIGSRNIDELDMDLDDFASSLGIEGVDDFDDLKNYSEDKLKEELPEKEAEITVDGETHDFSFDPESGEFTIDGKAYAIDKPTRAAAIGAVAGFAVAVFIAVAVVFLILWIVGVAIDVFVYNPIEYGCLKFFKKSRDEDQSLGVMFSGFREGYLNIVKVMFFRDLFVFLWSLLFIVPGIVKSYSYRLVPYILSENPSMSKDEALKESARLMNGNKWRVFVLDLSFIGWNILCLLTWGVLEIFYVGPYRNATNAALYETLKAEKNVNELPAV